MANEQSNKWHREKFGGNLPPYYTAEQSAELVATMFNKVKKILLRLYREYKVDGSEVFCLMGLAVYGAYAKGILHPEFIADGISYPKSDLDYFTLTLGHPILPHIFDFEDELKRLLNYTIPLENAGHVDISDQSDFRSHFSGNHSLLGKNFRIVTPHQNIQQLFKPQNLT